MRELSKIIPCPSCCGVGREGKNHVCDACDGIGLIPIEVALDGIIYVPYRSSDIGALPEIVKRLLATHAF
jgi:hypothetical protein